ncbi:MAG: aldo/keto reductase [Lachnospiraceae bacterium]|nr:aldo/keto reductase [Lachnospiraceae bacterium]
MQYRKNEKTGDELSVLGYGCMRYTRKMGSIDREKADREMLLALDKGVNYFDTAYAYPGSEEYLGYFMEKYQCRDRMKLATKLPQYKVKKREDIEGFFSEELSRLRTDHIDYYLLHMLNDVNSFNRLSDLGIREWLLDKKKNGVIRSIGFSFHGGTEAFKQLIDAWDWDFCQIQFNYMDEHSQAGIEGLTYASSKGLPVIIMEPLRGGRLATGLPEKARKLFEDEMPEKRSPASWGLRWIWNHPEVTVVLSGMNDVQQVEDNCATASESTPGCLSTEELAVYDRVLKAIHEKIKVGCTGCGYCQPCPKGVDIPTCFSTYNASYADSYFNALREYFMCTTLRQKRSNASLCVKCGKCEQVCPQHISIREELVRVKKRFESPLFKIGAAGSKLIMKY